VIQQRLRPLVLWLGLWLCSAVAIPSVVHAHAGDATGFASVAVSDASVRYTFTPTASFSADQGNLPALLRAHLQVTADGKPCVPDQTNQLVIVFQCVTTNQQISIEDHLDQVFGATHHVIALFTWNGGS